MSTVQPVRHDVKCHEISCNEGVGGGLVMQEGELHCHAFPKEKKSLNLGGAGCSISSRNLQLVPREPSQMCVAMSRRTVLPLSLLLLFVTFSRQHNKVY